MSLQAVLWALYDVPKEKVKGAALRVLLTLADHADPDGKGAYPSQATLAKLTGYGRHTIQTTLSTLENEGLITKGDQRLTAHLQYRPIVWDLAIHQDTQTTTDTAGAQSGAQSGAQYDCAQTNKHINHINQERDARTRTREEHHINQTWKPKPKHKALADELRLDLDWEAQKFIARARDRGDASADWDARFETWLRRGAELGIHAATPAHLEMLAHAPAPAPAGRRSRTRRYRLHHGQRPQRRHRRRSSHTSHRHRQPLHPPGPHLGISIRRQP